MSNINLFSRVGYILTNKFFVTILNFLSLVIFARYLVPQDYGIFALSISIIGIYKLIINTFSEYVIHRQKISKEIYSSFFWFNIVSGGCLFVFTLIFREGLSALLNMPELALTCSVLSFFLFLESFGIQGRLKLTKELNFKFITIVESVSAILSFMISYILIILGYSYWGLIAKFGLDFLLPNILFFFCVKWKPQFIFSYKHLKEGVSYSFPLLGNSCCIGVTLFFQNYLINNFIGKVGLGLYSQSQKILALPLHTIIYPIGRLAFPVLSELKDDKEAFKFKYLLLCNTVALIALPAVLFIILFPKECTLILLGKNWVDVIPVLQALAIALIMTCTVNVHKWLFLSTGRTVSMFKMSILKFIVYLIGIGLTVKHGIVAVAYSISFSELFLFFPFIFAAKKGTNIKISEILKTQLMGLLVGIIPLIIPFILWKYLNSSNLSSFVLYIIPIYVLVYLGLFKKLNILTNLNENFKK